MTKITLQLTSDQQTQIKNAIGKDVKELRLNFGGHCELSESELGRVQGGSATKMRSEIELDSFSFGASNS